MRFTRNNPRTRYSSTVDDYLIDVSTRQVRQRMLAGFECNQLTFLRKRRNTLPAYYKSFNDIQTRLACGDIQQSVAVHPH